MTTRLNLHSSYRETTLTTQHHMDMEAKLKFLCSEHTIFSGRLIVPLLMMRHHFENLHTHYSFAINTASSAFFCYIQTLPIITFSNRILFNPRTQEKAWLHFSTLRGNISHHCLLHCLLCTKVFYTGEIKCEIIFRWPAVFEYILCNAIFGRLTVLKNILRRNFHIKICWRFTK